MHLLSNINIIHVLKWKNGEFIHKGINENISEDTKLNIELNKKIGELKEKLELYPFELLKGEKLLSVNFSVIKLNSKLLCIFARYLT